MNGFAQRLVLKQRQRQLGNGLFANESSRDLIGWQFDAVHDIFGGLIFETAIFVHDVAKQPYLSSRRHADVILSE